MFGITSDTKVYVRTGVTDMRLAFEGLRGLVVKVLHADPRAGHLFVFCNRRANRIKILWFDGTGYMIAAKRLDRSTFDFPRDSRGVGRMSTGQLRVLLQGVEFRRPNGGQRR